jgi:hypothetical protein
MYIQKWNKYLPVIKILMKRSVAGEQIFNLNVLDFRQSGATRKVGHKFEVHFINGKVDNIITSDLAKDFAIAIFEDVNTKLMLTQNNYHVSMDSKFQLTIKYIAKTPSEEVVNEDLANEEVLVS